MFESSLAYTLAGLFNASWSQASVLTCISVVLMPENGAGLAVPPKPCERGVLGVLEAYMDMSFLLSLAAALSLVRDLKMRVPTTK